MSELLDKITDSLDEGFALISQEGALIKNNRKMTPYLMMEGFYPALLELSYVAMKRRREITGEFIRGRSTMLIKAIPVEEVIVIILKEVYYSSIAPKTIREDIEEDLEFAKSIQLNTLPQKKLYGNLTIDYIYEPSEILSGDIFDIFRIDPNHVGMYVADVSGHGIAAAMMTMFIKQIFNSIRIPNMSPATTLEILYERFYELNLPIEKYITCFYAIYNIEEERLHYSNAGHNCPPLVYDGKSWTELDLSGFPIFSLFPQVRYKEESIEFKEDYKLFLYTDGITENKDDFGEIFGEKRLHTLLKNHPSNVLERIEKVSSLNRWFSHEDDYCAVLIERKGDLNER